MGEREYSVWIKAAPEQVWQVYVDPRRIPEWQTGRPVIGDVQGVPGRSGSTYLSKRGPLSARTTVLTSRAPARAGDEDRHLPRPPARGHLAAPRAVGRHRPGASRGDALASWTRPDRYVVELAILNPGEARKELAHLKTLVEREA